MIAGLDIRHLSRGKHRAIDKAHSQAARVSGPGREADSASLHAVTGGNTAYSLTAISRRAQVSLCVW
jgi:hypothetical protein